MNRNLIYGIIVLILTVLVYFFVVRPGSGSFRGDEKAFGMKDTASIGKIFLADLAGKSITVTREDEVWRLEDGQPARKEQVQSIMHALSQMEVNVPVAKSMFDNVVRNIAGDHTKVEVYDRKGKKVRSFFIGPISTTYRGNFMLVDGSKTPFVVHIPGFDGFIHTRFVMDPYEWKDRTVFSYRPDRIRKLELTYPQVPDSSFVLHRSEEGEYRFESGLGDASSFNPEIGNYYLNKFKDLNCELFVPEEYKLDSLQQLQPVCRIAVTRADGETRDAAIYYRPVTYRTKLQFTYQGQELNFDVDKFYAIINQPADLAIIQNFVFGDLFVGPSYFMRQRPSNVNVLVEEIMGGEEGVTIDLMK